jgi:hypothetical protein
MYATSPLIGGCHRRLVLAMALLALAACDAGDPTAANPQKVFRDGFVAPSLAAVKIEAEGGSVVRGYDAWLKLSTLHALQARHGEAFRVIDCAQPRRFFQRVLVDDDWPEDALLRCLGMSDTRFAFDNGRWLIYNTANGRYYFRVWKHD